MSKRPLTRLRKYCLGLPEAHEAEAWGAPTFRVKTIFAMYSHEGHYGNEEGPSAWIKALPANQGFLIDAAPARFFVPPYVGPKGWVGARLNDDTDWNELRDLLWDAWQMSVPKKLLAQHSAPPPGWV